MPLNCDIANFYKFQFSFQGFKLTPTLSQNTVPDIAILKGFMIYLFLQVDTGEAIDVGLILCNPNPNPNNPNNIQCSL